MSPTRGRSVASIPIPMMFMPEPSGGFEWTQAPWGRVLRCRPLLEVADHFFTAGSLRLARDSARSEEHTSELQSRLHLVCRLLLEKKKKKRTKDLMDHKLSDLWQ